MAYDPEARRQSNSALIVGLIGLLIAGGAALAYFANRNSTPETAAPVVVTGPGKTVVVQATAAPAPVVVVTSAPRTNTVVVPVPVTGTTIVKPGTTVVAPGTTTVTRNTTITRNTRIVAPPAASATAVPRAVSGSGNQTNVTVNNVLPTTAPATGTSGTTNPAPDAGSSSTNTETGDGTTANSAAGY